MNNSWPWYHFNISLLWRSPNFGNVAVRQVPTPDWRVWHVSCNFQHMNDSWPWKCNISLVKTNPNFGNVAGRQVPGEFDMYLTTCKVQLVTLSAAMYQSDKNSPQTTDWQVWHVSYNFQHKNDRGPPSLLPNHVVLNNCEVSLMGLVRAHCPVSHIITLNFNSFSIFQRNNVLVIYFIECCLCNLVSPLTCCFLCIILVKTPTAITYNSRYMWTLPC